MKGSVLLRINKLEKCFTPSEVELPFVDFSLLSEVEQSYFSKQMRVLRRKARELGYGDGPEANLHNVGWFDLGDFDPVINRRVEMECLAALSEQDLEVIQTLREVVGKIIRLTNLLSEDEKAFVRRFNEVSRFLKNGRLTGTKEVFEEQGFSDLRLGYQQIMMKYGENVFE